MSVTRDWRWTSRSDVAERLIFLAETEDFSTTPDLVDVIALATTPELEAVAIERFAAGFRGHRLNLLADARDLLHPPAPGVLGWIARHDGEPLDDAEERAAWLAEAPPASTNRASSPRRCRPTYRTAR